LQIQALPARQRFQLLPPRSRPDPDSHVLTPPCGPRKERLDFTFDRSQSWNCIALVLAFLGYLIARAEFTAATKMRFNGNTCEKKFVATRRRSGGPFHATALGHVSRLNCWMILNVGGVLVPSTGCEY
jgi:hypothetical protein